MSHEIGLAVWDLPSPVVIGRRATLKVGISCPCGCSLTGTTIEIRDEQGARIASGRIGSAPWPDTLALYWVQLEAASPDTDGTHTWSIYAAAADSLHPPLESSMRVVASRAPEHRVTFEVVEQGRGTPLAGVELRIGAFRATTDEEGSAHIDVPGGNYDVHAWKRGYDLLSSTASVADDMILQLEVTATAEAEQPYWM